MQVYGQYSIKGSICSQERIQCVILTSLSFPSCVNKHLNISKLSSCEAIYIIESLNVAFAQKENYEL
jgi:hypothetical protein